jgi:hypothetical protein
LLGKSKHRAFGIYYSAIIFYWDWKAQNKLKNCKKFGYFCSRFKLQHYFLLCIWKVHVRKQSGIQLLLPYWSIAIHLIFNKCICNHINHLLQPSFHIYVLNAYACLKKIIIGVSTSLKVKNSCPLYSFKFCFTFTFFQNFFYSFPLLTFQ